MKGETYLTRWRHSPAGFSTRNRSNRLVGVRLVDSGPGFAVLALDVGEHLTQQHGLVHGGVISQLAANSLTYAGGLALQGDALISPAGVGAGGRRPGPAGPRPRSRCSRRSRAVRASQAAVEADGEAVGRLGALRQIGRPAGDWRRSGVTAICSAETKLWLDSSWPSATASLICCWSTIASSSPSPRPYRRPGAACWSVANTTTAGVAITRCRAGSGHPLLRACGGRFPRLPRRYAAGKHVRSCTRVIRLRRWRRRRPSGACP